MDPLSMHVVNFLLPPRPEPAVDAPKDSSTPGLSAVGQIQPGLGALANRQIAVGPGEDRKRAQTGAAIIGSILSAVSSAIQAIVHSPLILTRKLGSYVMRAWAPAPSPVVVKFHEEATVLTGPLAKAPLLQQPAPVPRGLHLSATKDWLRDGVAINGNMYGGKDGKGALDMDVAAKLLTRMCKGNPAAAEWISRFANQQAAAPLMSALMQQPLGPNGSCNFLFVGGCLSAALSALPDGGVQLDMRYQWQPSDSPHLYLDPESSYHVDEHSSLTASWSLRFDAPADASTQDMPHVSVLKELDCRANILPAARQAP